MTAKRTPDNLRYARELYESGKTLDEVACTLDIGVTTAYLWIKESGGTIRPRQGRICRKETDVLMADVVAGFQAGMSVKALAVKYGHSRQVIHRLLRKGSIQSRGRSESMHLRMSQTTADERKRLARYAHEATRGKPINDEWAANIALSKQRSLSKVGAGEMLFMSWLMKRGIKAVPQLAVGPYNFDLAIHPVAVEIHVQACNPINSPVYRKRIKYITDHGWHVLYIWISKTHFLIEDAAVDAIAFIEAAKSDPSPIGKYRVIRGSGEFVAEGRGDLD